MAATAERARDECSVDRFRATPDDDEDPLVHLHEEHEDTRVGEIHDLVREVRDCIDVLGPANGCDQYVVRRNRLQPLHEVGEELALVRGERRMEVLGDEVLARSVAEAPGERVDVALGRRRVRQRAGVLVDTEREGGRLERRRLQLALGEDADERRGQRTVGRDHCGFGRYPVGRAVLAVVVEEHGLHQGSSATLSSSPRREAVATSTTISRRIASSSSGSSRTRLRARLRAGGRSRGRSGSAWRARPTASGYRRRAASIAPKASKSVFPWVAMT